MRVKSLVIILGDVLTAVDTRISPTTKFCGEPAKYGKIRQPLTAAEKQAFDLLTRVQHVGPKLALAVLSVLAPEELAAAIARDDIDRIDAVPGVGRKVAERVVRELRDKVAELKLAPPQPRAASLDGQAELLDDAVSALVNLGYKRAEARRAVDSVGPAAVAAGVETIIRHSLALLFGEK